MKNASPHVVPPRLSHVASRLLLCCLLTTGGLFTAACGDAAAPIPPSVAGTGGQAPDTDDDGDQGPGGGAPDPKSEGGQDGGFVFTGSGGSGGEESCHNETEEAELKGLDMIVVLDRSGSMGAPDRTGTRWEHSVEALTAFIQDANSVGVHMGMSFFPAKASSKSEICTPGEYSPPHLPKSATPAVFQLADLSVASEAQSIIDGMHDQGDPSGSTPTYGALEGTYVWAAENQKNNPNRKTLVVFVSDGGPAGCPDPQNEKEIIAALGEKARSDHGIETYVIGLKGAKFSQLDELAKAGGTEQAFDLTKDAQAFNDKMLQIREQALGCEYLVPEQKQSEADFDPKKVNVHYASADGEPVELSQAADDADCADSEGWYYDDPATPSKIILCPVTCAAVAADNAAKVSLTFGCPTKLN